jgi:hypothetical protein
VKTRSYGLFASARRADLQVAHELLAIQSEAENRSQPETSDQDPDSGPIEKPRADDPDPRCTVCNEGSMRSVADIPRNSAATWTWARAPPETVVG